MDKMFKYKHLSVTYGRFRPRIYATTGNKYNRHLDIKSSNITKMPEGTWSTALFSHKQNVYTQLRAQPVEEWRGNVDCVPDHGICCLQREKCDGELRLASEFWA